MAGHTRSFSSSAFSPAAARQTSVCLLRNVGTGDHRLVTSISTRKSTEVLHINLRTGRLELENDRTAESSYENESEALDHLTGRGYEVVERGYALLGYATAGPLAGLLLATRVREKAVLPGGHTLYAVTDSQWAMVPLQNEAADAATASALAGLPPPRADGEFWRALQQFTLNNAHYYCETADISRPFPSTRDPRDPAPEFVWNTWLRQPLVELGLYDHCPALLQGAVECSSQVLPGGRFSMCLISRRSRRHPGTRYIARGLNALAGPGNEIECELLTWTHPEQQYTSSTSAVQSGGSPSLSGAGGVTYSFSAAGGGGVREGGHGGSGGSGGEPLRWARCVWRRGTVPIWWGVQLQSLAQGLQAEVYVREEHPYQGTASYFRNVQRQHAPRPALPPADGAGGGQQQQGAGGEGSEGWTLVEGGPGGNGGTSTHVAAAAAVAGGAPSAAGAAAAAAAGGEVPVTCINLLHANPKKASELMLSSHFQDAMRHVRRRLGAEAPIRVVNFDWHGNMGKLTEEKAVEGFWSLMEPFVKQTGFASGWMEAATDAPQPSCKAAAAAADGGGAAPAAAPATHWPPGWRMRWSGQQRGLLRFNCADSLDRTNAATCFAMLPVLQEQLRVLGITLECAVPPATAALQRSRQRSSAGDVTALERQAVAAGDVAEAAAAGALPEGWEVRQHEGRLLYIDHVNKATQWTPPGVSSAASGASTPSGSGATPRGRPTSAGTRLVQTASDWVARLQRGGVAGAGGSSSSSALGASGVPKATPMLNLEQRSSPPRPGAPPEGATSGAGGVYWRSGSSGSLSSMGGVPHAASAPDMSLPSRPSTAASEAPSRIGAVGPDQDPRRPWAFFDYDITDVRERLSRDTVGDYVEMFRVHGDIHSFLYTGSPAMHSHVLNLVVQGGKGYGAASGVGKLQNLRVAVQRRWNNTVSDASRQQAMELFLGLRIHDQAGQKGYFPGLQVAYPDSTQAALGGLEPFEFTPLPPAPHSRHSSTLPGQLGPLGAGAPSADALSAAVTAAAAGGLGRQRLPLLEEEGADLEAEAAGAGQLSLAAPDQQQQEQQDQQEATWDRAHAVPGVHAVSHNGMVGVRQSLMDLEPFAPDYHSDYQQHHASHQRSSSGGGSGSSGGSRPLHSSSDASSVSGGVGPSQFSSSECSSSVEGLGPELAQAPAQPPAFDPLGAVPSPPLPAPAGAGDKQQDPHLQQQPEGLISFGDDTDAAPSPDAPPAENVVRSKLEDLLL